jgi:hypothetical protein
MRPPWSVGVGRAGLVGPPAPLCRHFAGGAQADQSGPLASPGGGAGHAGLALQKFGEPKAVHVAAALCAASGTLRAGGTGENRPLGKGRLEALPGVFALQVSGDSPAGVPSPLPPSRPARGAARSGTRTQAMQLIAWARDAAGRADIADSWAVAWHFCLRYGAEVVPLNGRGHSVVTVATEAQRLRPCRLMAPRGWRARAQQKWPALISRSARPTANRSSCGGGACLSRGQRRHERHPCAPALPTRCVCELQGRRLCGVCVLHRRVPRGGALVFPHASYRDGLALVKLGAMDLKCRYCACQHAVGFGYARQVPEGDRLGHTLLPEGQG